MADSATATQGIPETLKRFRERVRVIEEMARTMTYNKLVRSRQSAAEYRVINVHLQEGDGVRLTVRSTTGPGEFYFTLDQVEFLP